MAAPYERVSAGEPLSLWQSMTSNRNVWLAMVFTVLLQSGLSILAGTVFVVFIFSLPGGSNARVGELEAVSGLVQLAISLPAGILTDRLPRANVLRFGGVIGAAAIVLSLLALSKGRYVYFLSSQALWGLFAGVTDSALNSLFADSTPTGRRTAIFSLRGALSEGAQCLGPLIVLVLFAATGNSWTLETMRWILCFGAVLLTAPVALLFFFSDANSLGLASESALAAPSTHGSPTALRNDHNAASAASSHGDDEAAAAEPVERSVSQARAAYGRWHGFGVEHVPYLIVGADIVFSLAAGMTVPYLGLFFYSEYRLSPMGLQCIFALVPIATFVAIQGGGHVSRFAGRMQTMLLSRVVAIAALFGMCFVQPFVLVAVLLIVRTSFMRVTSPLMRSILMDVIPKRSRGRWNAFEGINSAGFTGSAFAGGYLIDHYSYRTAFLATAIVFAVTTLVWVPMLFILPRNETAMAIDADTGAEARAKAVPLTAMRDAEHSDDALVENASADDSAYDSAPQPAGAASE